jgi:ribonuclease HI
MSKNKFFVVWKGKQPGIYSSWEECNRQVHQFEGAKFKGFATEKEAQQAFKSPFWKYIGTSNNAQKKPARGKKNTSRATDNGKYFGRLLPAAV